MINAHVIKWFLFTPAVRFVIFIFKCLMILKPNWIGSQGWLCLFFGGTHQFHNNFWWWRIIQRNFVFVEVFGSFPYCYSLMVPTAHTCTVEQAVKTAKITFSFILKLIIGLLHNIKSRNLKGENQNSKLYLVTSPFENLHKSNLWIIQKHLKHPKKRSEATTPINYLNLVIMFMCSDLNSFWTFYCSYI